MSTDLVGVSMFIIFAPKDSSVARVDQWEAVLSISNPSGHITSRQESVVEFRPVQKKSVSEILELFL